MATRHFMCAVLIRYRGVPYSCPKSGKLLIEVKYREIFNKNVTVNAVCACAGIDRSQPREALMDHLGRMPDYTVHPRGL
jgi:hypothetical protein